jgi:predicted permease
MAGQRSEDDFAREIEAHLALETDRLIADGVPPDQARDRARRAFGNVVVAQERFHEANRIAWIDELRRDLRSAIRNVRRNPVSGVIVVLSLAGGIGAATAALIVRNVIFHNPPPLYVAPDDLAQVQAAPRERPILPAGSDVPVALFRRWRQDLGTGIAGAMGARPGDVQHAGEIETLPIRAVTPNLFHVLGIRPVAGRLFDPEGQSGLTGEVVLSYGIWQRTFGGRSDIAGTPVSINGLPATVVGVLPDRFWFMDMSDQVWVAADERLMPADISLQTVARRTPDLGAAGLSTVLLRGVEAYNRDRSPGAPRLHIRVSSIGGTPMGAAMSLALPYIMGMAVALVLLIGCANAAILLIAQWTAREADTAVRSSLGASRGRLVRALLTEAVCLSVTAGICGVLATLILRWFVMTRMGANLAMFDVSIPPRVLVQSAAIAIGAGIVAGLAPALYETARLQLNPLRGLQSSDRLRQRWSHALVVAEISITVALLVMTTSMAIGYQRLRDAQFGFDTRHTAVVAVRNETGVAVRPLLDRVATVRRIRAAAVASSAPMYSQRPKQLVALDDHGGNELSVERNAVTPSFFDTIDVAMRAGRTFAEQDGSESGVVVINETLARRLLGTTAALGRQIWIARVPHIVVGVVADYATTYQEFQAIAPKFFVPLDPQPRGERFLYVLSRADGNVDSVTQPLQRALRPATGGNPITEVYTYMGMADVITREWLVALAPLGPLITMGIILTAAGIYGVLAFAIARRTRELAIRVSLGATDRDQIWLVSLRSLRLVATGTAIGVGLTFTLAQLARIADAEGSYLYPPWAAFVLPVAIMLVVASIATWLPMLRARKIDPVVLLRTM